MAFWIPFLISTALSAGASAADSAAQRRVEAARTAAQRAELDRQEAFRQQSRQRFSDLLAGQEKEAQLAKQAEEQAKLQTAFEGNVQPTKRFTELLPGQGDSSDIIQSAVVDEGNKGAQKTLSSARKRAALETFGRLNLRNDIDFANTKQDIGMIGTSANNSLNILPLELEAANSKGGGMRRLASLLRGASEITSAAAGAGAFGSGNPTGSFVDKAGRRIFEFDTNGIFPGGFRSAPLPPQLPYFRGGGLG